jgi:hypothetical protein
MLLVLILLSVSHAAGKERTLYNFTDGKDGGHPGGRLIADAAGNLYGTTSGGGRYTCPSLNYDKNCGTVFELIPGTNGQWKEKVLYNFRGGADGAHPFGTLSFDAAGNLFGTTAVGGPGPCTDGKNQIGCGTVFELLNGSRGHWSEKVLYSFRNPNGPFPGNGVVLDTAGNLYGTTPWALSSYGTVFQLKRGTNGPWRYKVLHTFSTKDSSGYGPSELVFDHAGNLYGANESGPYPTGGGTIFKLTLGARGKWKAKALWSFNCAGTDVCGPLGPLIFDKGGNLYGTGSGGNTSNGCGLQICGTVFELMTNGHGQWSEKVLYKFQGMPDASNPNGGLAIDEAGNLYGTSWWGGANCAFDGSSCPGSVFELIPGGNGTWTETVLHSFGLNTDGSDPEAGLLLDAGELYGTCTYGGKYYPGTVYKLTP